MATIEIPRGVIFQNYFGRLSDEDADVFYQTFIAPGEDLQSITFSVDITAYDNDSTFRIHVVEIDFNPFLGYVIGDTVYTSADITVDPIPGESLVYGAGPFQEITVATGGVALDGGKQYAIVFEAVPDGDGLPDQLTFAYNNNEPTGYSGGGFGFLRGTDGDFTGDRISPRTADLALTLEFSAASANTPPEAVDDFGDVVEDQVLRGDLLANDSDADGDELRVISASHDGVDLVPGTPIEGEWGTLRVQEDGTYVYAANADALDLLSGPMVLEDSFTYKITDGNGETATATLTINVTLADDEVVTDGGNGSDVLLGDANGLVGAEDTIFGGTGADVISGLDGADKLHGDKGNDVILGGDGYDLLDGGNGDDVLVGGAGQDRLVGGKGSDTLSGGEDADTFVFGKSNGDDLVLDFEVGLDLIELVDGVKVKGQSVSDVDGDGMLDLVLQLSNGSVTLLGVDTPLADESFA